jgi:hypothetical protein
MLKKSRHGKIEKCLYLVILSYVEYVECLRYSVLSVQEILVRLAACLKGHKSCCKETRLCGWV